MKEVIKEFLEPSKKEKQELWEKAVFVFDTNVLLNLYRYSAKTRNSLLNAFESFTGRIWIPYQVACEYMRKRCEVIYETVQRYDQFKKEAETFTGKAVETLRLTSNDEEVSELKRYLFKWLDSNKERNLLVLNPEEDEILEKILKIFDGKVGGIVPESELDVIKKEGEEQYKKSIPPGYKDGIKKKGQEDDNNAYGDLIIWKQIIKYSKENNIGIIYVTHDQKEDWWNIVKGKTIGPRVELRREFFAETKQEFHMYSMNNFISTYNSLNEVQIDKSAVEEVISLDRAVNKRCKERSYSMSEKIAKVEETLEKIQNRISRRRKIIMDIENKYQKQGLEMPENIKTQYNNTKQKMEELEHAHAIKQKELEGLKENLKRREMDEQVLDIIMKEY